MKTKIGVLVLSGALMIGFLFTCGDKQVEDSRRRPTPTPIVLPHEYICGELRDLMIKQSNRKPQSANTRNANAHSARALVEIQQYCEGQDEQE